MIIMIILLLNFFPYQVYGERLFSPACSGMKTDLEILPDDGVMSVENKCKVNGFMNDDFIIDVDVTPDVCPSVERKKSFALKDEVDISPGIKRKLAEEFDVPLKFSKRKNKLVAVKIEPKD